MQIRILLYRLIRPPDSDSALTRSVFSHATCRRFPWCGTFKPIYITWLDCLQGPSSHRPIYHSHHPSRRSAWEFCMNQMISETHSHPEVELWLKAAKIPRPNSQPYDGKATSLEYLEIFQGSQQFHIKKDVEPQAFARYCEVSLSSTL